MNVLQTVEAEVKRYRDNVMRLGQLSDQVTPHIDNATVVLLTSRENTLNQRLTSLQQTIAKYMHGAHAQSGRQDKFREAYTLVNSFLAEAREKLQADDPNKSASESDIRQRLDELKLVSHQMNRQQASLDLLNEIGFRLSLNPVNAARLRELNEQWKRVVVESARRRRQMQGTLLVHEDFDAKLDDWGGYLEQVEEDLVADIARNYPHLLAQQQAYAVSINIYEYRITKV